MASVPKLELRDFHTVQRDLESVLLKLKSSFNPEVRRSLLRELRLKLAARAGVREQRDSPLKNAGKSLRRRARRREESAGKKQQNVGKGDDFPNSTAEPMVANR